MELIKNKMNTLDAIDIIEEGNSDANEIIDAYQYLINVGIVWNLQGSYGRMAKNLIERGICHNIRRNKNGRY